MAVAMVKLCSVLAMMAGAAALQVSKKEMAADTMTPLDLWRWKNEHKHDDDFEEKLAGIGADEQSNEDASEQDAGSKKKKKKAQKDKKGTKEKDAKGDDDNASSMNPWETIKSWGDAIMGRSTDEVVEGSEESVAKDASTAHWNPFGVLASDDEEADTNEVSTEKQSSKEDVLTKDVSDEKLPTKPSADELFSDDKRKASSDLHEKHSAPADQQNEPEEDSNEGAVVAIPAGSITLPLMLISSGCDASDAIMHHAHEILRLNGIQTPEKKKYSLHSTVDQVLSNAEEGLGDDVLIEDDACEGSCRAMVQMNKDFANSSQSLMFKALIAGDKDAILSKSVLEMAPLVVAISRRNKLDQVVCMVKDCINNRDLGHPMMNGVTSDLCWSRRHQQPGASYKAWVKDNLLLENMRKLENKSQSLVGEMREMGHKVETFYMEDLLDFEWNPHAMGTSYYAWAGLLNAWGVHANKHENETKHYLWRNHGTRDPPVSHKESVVNVDEVEKIVMNNDKFKWMYRETTTATGVKTNETTVTAKVSVPTKINTFVATVTNGSVANAIKSAASDSKSHGSQKKAKPTDSKKTSDHAKSKH